MKLSLLLGLCSLLYLSLNVSALGQGPQTIRGRRLNFARATNTTGEFPEQWFIQPLDHFTQDSPTFKQRYWVNKRHYVPGKKGPVIVLDGGETSGEDRLPFLDTGIVEILAIATGGVGVVLEHRYYGESTPVANLTTDSLRWLNNKQALEDSAKFMANVKFDGISEDLTAPNTPWIYYGGSYAGARAAHMRVLYPDLVYGAIASSGVTHASVELWEYMDVIRTYANKTCSWHLQNLAPMIDTMLSEPGTNKAVKSLFGLEGLEHDWDFVNTIETGLQYWQSKNWDPAVGTTQFDDFCNEINRPFNSLADAVSTTGIDPQDVTPLTGAPGFDLALFNYASWVRTNVLPACPSGQTVEQCFGSYNDTQFQITTLDQTWRLWQFQVCTQWGYFFVSPPDPNFPRIVSNLHTLENESKICRQAFPPGQYFTVPPLPDVASVNALGSFSIEKDRLAIIDGEVDPWRPVTPHSQYYAQPRPDTVSKPFKLIPNAVHHWDENGLKDPSQEPAEIQKIHRETVEFVQAWLKDFWK